MFLHRRNCQGQWGKMLYGPSAACFVSAARTQLWAVNNLGVSDGVYATSLRIEYVSDIGHEHNGLQLKKQGFARAQRLS